MSIPLTDAVGIRLLRSGAGAAGCGLRALVERGEQLLGEGEVLAGEPGGLLGEAGEHGIGEPGVLLDGPAPHVLAVRLAVEAEPDLVLQPHAQLGELRVVGRRRDRLVHLEVGEPGGVAVRARVGVRPHREADPLLVLRDDPLRGRAGDLLLDDRAEVERLLQRAPALAERTLHAGVGGGPPLRDDERAAGAAALHPHVARARRGGRSPPARSSGSPRASRRAPAGSAAAARPRTARARTR